MLGRIFSVLCGLAGVLFVLAMTKRTGDGLGILPVLALIGGMFGVGGTVWRGKPYLGARFTRTDVRIGAFGGAVIIPAILAAFLGASTTGVAEVIGSCLGLGLVLAPSLGTMVPNGIIEARAKEPSSLT